MLEIVVAVVALVRHGISIGGMDGIILHLLLHVLGRGIEAHINLGWEGISIDHGGVDGIMIRYCPGIAEFLANVVKHGSEPPPASFTTFCAAVDE